MSEGCFLPEWGIVDDGWNLWELITLKKRVSNTSANSYHSINFSDVSVFDLHHVLPSQSPPPPAVRELLGSEFVAIVNDARSVYLLRREGDRQCPPVIGDDKIWAKVYQFPACCELHR